MALDDLSEPSLSEESGERTTGLLGKGPLAGGIVIFSCFIILFVKEKRIMVGFDMGFIVILVLLCWWTLI